MGLLINLYNQIGAGPKNISLNLIRGLEKTRLEENIFVIVPDFDEYATLVSNNSKLHFIKYPRKERLYEKVWFRLYLELWLIPRLMREQTLKQLLAFGNFLFTPGNFDKLVLCHHPYLYDNSLLSSAEWPLRFEEYLKRVAFGLTLCNVKHLVVQSDYVASQLRATWRLSDKTLCHVIANPISSNFQKPDSEQLLSLIRNRRQNIKEKVKILYVSRFYPHKNHRFLLALSSQLQNLGTPHEIQVTIDPSISEAKDFLHAVSKSKLPIVNLGELPQQEMATVYQQSHIFIFPSHAETFGNPMIEAMCYGLPMVVPDTGYAKAIVSSAGHYYPTDDAKECTHRILELIHSDEMYVKCSMSSHDAFVKFPNVSEWISIYLNSLKQARQKQ